MAAVKGVNQTKIDNGGVENMLENGLINGRVKVYQDSYTPDGTEASASTIKVGGKLPAGAKIVGVALATDALGSGVTLSVGDSNSATRYYNAVDCHNTKRHNAIEHTGMGYKVGTNTGDDQVVITTGGATLTNAKVIKISIFVAID